MLVMPAELLLAAPAAWTLQRRKRVPCWQRRQLRHWMSQSWQCRRAEKQRLKLRAPSSLLLKLSLMLCLLPKQRPLGRLRLRRWLLVAALQQTMSPPRLCQQPQPLQRRWQQQRRRLLQARRRVPLWPA